MSKNDPDQEFLAREKAERKRFAAVKARLCKALKEQGIASVTIEYDGEGDSGQIGDIAARSSDNKPLDIEAPITLAIHKPKTPTRYASLSDALDDFAWTVLQFYHGGFQDNEGGFGTLTIHVSDGKVTIDHNNRFTDVENTVTEV